MFVGAMTALVTPMRNGQLDAKALEVLVEDQIAAGIDGLEILETLRGEPETARVPVLACTALGQRDSGPLLVKAGFDALVPKPIDWRALERLLARLE